MGYTKGQSSIEQYEDANGNPLVNGTLEFFLWNTSTPQNVYKDSSGTVLGTTVTLNALGQPQDSGGNEVDIFYDDTLEYKIVRKDSGGTAIDPTIGPFRATAAGISQSGVQNSESQYATNNGSTANAHAVTLTPNLDAYAAGQKFHYIVPLTNTAQAVTLNVDSQGAKTLVYPDGTPPKIGELPADSVLQVVYDGTDFQIISRTQNRYPAEYLGGFDVSVDSGDTDHDVGIAIGSARDEANRLNIDLDSAIVKQIDATWVAGTGAGGMATSDGSTTLLAADTTYNIFAITEDDGTCDVGFDTSSSASNLLTNDATTYTGYRKIGEVITDGSSNIQSVVMTHQDESKYNARVLLQRGSHSAASSVNIPLDKGYRYFELMIDRYQHTGAPSSIMYFRFGNDGSVDSGASDYNYEENARGSYNGAVAAQISAGSLTVGEGTTAAVGLIGKMTILNAFATDRYTSIVGQLWQLYATANSEIVSLMGSRLELAEHDILQILDDGGTTFDLEYSLYGVK
jgi:hypothetical protein